MAEIADPADAALLACEDGLLDIYADLGALYRPKTEDRARRAGAAHREHAGALRVVPAVARRRCAPALPAGYRARLERALGRFGVSSLERTPALESALMWLFRSFTRVGELSPVVSAILQRRMAHRDVLAGPSGGAATKARLERLTAATQGRQQAVADLARDLRFHCFDEPPMEAAAAELRAEMAGHLAHLARQPDSADRADRIERLVWCPQPMRSLLLDVAGATTRRRLPRCVAWCSRCTSGASTASARSARSHFGRGRRVRATPTADYTLDGEKVRLVVGYLPLAASCRRGRLRSPRTSRPWPPRASWSSTSQPGAKASTPRSPRPRQRGGRHPDARAPSAARCSAIDVAVTSASAPRAEHMRTHNVTFVEAGRRGVRREPAVPRPAPDARQAPGDLAPVQLRARAAAVAGRRAPVPRRGPQQPRRPAAVRAGRDPRARRRRAIRQRARCLTRDSNAPVCSRWRRCGPSSRATRPRDRPVANRLVLDVGAPWTLPPSTSMRSPDASRRSPPRVGLEKVVLKVRHPRRQRGRRPARRRAEVRGRRALASWSPRVAPAPSRFARWARYQQKVLTAARFGSPYPYEIVRLFTQRGAGSGSAGRQLPGARPRRRRPAGARPARTGDQLGPPDRRTDHQPHRRGAGRNAARRAAVRSRPKGSAIWPNRNAAASMPRSPTRRSTACRWSGSRCAAAR